MRRKRKYLMVEKKGGGRGGRGGVGGAGGERGEGEALDDTSAKYNVLIYFN